MMTARVPRVRSGGGGGTEVRLVLSLMNKNLTDVTLA